MEPGIPLDVSRANMFDTTYVHPLLRDSMVLWHYYHCGSEGSVRNAIIRPRVTYLHDRTPTAVLTNLLVFFNKSMKVCPYISLPYRPSVPGRRLWLYALRSAIVQTPIADTNGRHVDLAPWPKEITRDGTVHFIDNQQPEYSRLRCERIKPDIIILCTGYKQEFPFLQSSREKATRAYPMASQANVRGIWRCDEPTIGFIGFLRPSLGAIPPLAEMQAQLWILNILAPEKIPRSLRAADEEHYRLKLPPGSRMENGVDHESYVWRLASDMNSAIGLWGVLAIAHKKCIRDGWRLLVIWAYNAHFNTKFRLLGPWKWSGAADTLISEEFWQTITRRPLFFGKGA
ncbi:hypothetical protein FSARC_13414 [Fusarium sarcochroum]|uniref:Monooxygenase n=1 Tax=Fusarium sarcochroum TaxID=1208366 RepID=A0A8H4T1S6_9HYPO|nr:hypothetical protein FSARC_13414 [Fusarium sarcochroum]